jgi:hypothetical protein
MENVIWLPERNTHPNRVLENRKSIGFSGPLTKGGKLGAGLSLLGVQLSMIKQQA